jgi:predicted transcriptional regulator
VVADGKRGERRRRGALEQQILGCLAVSPEPMTPAEVQEALGSELAYTTVMTTLTRLYEKRALTRAADGRAFRYALVGDATEAAANVTAHQMLRLLDKADRAKILSRFVADLEPGDEALLTKLLQAAGEPDKTAGRPRRGRGSSKPAP